MVVLVVAMLHIVRKSGQGKMAIHLPSTHFATRDNWCNPAPFWQNHRSHRVTAGTLNGQLFRHISRGAASSASLYCSQAQNKCQVNQHFMHRPCVCTIILRFHQTSMGFGTGFHTYLENKLSFNK